MTKFLILLYLVSLAVFSIFSFSFVDVSLSYFNNFYSGLYLTHRLELSLIYIILISILFGCFYFFITHHSEINRQIKKIILTIIVFSILAYPGALSFDIFNYMTTAKVAYYYQENPYVVYPIEFLNEPYLLFTRAANKLALYAPFWILLSAIPYYAGFGNFILTLISFKALIAIFYLATVYLISKMDRVAAIFFALNPLVVIETLVSSHNDIVMVFFALLAFYLFFQKRYGLFVFSLLGSILIKFATVFLIPAFAVMVRDIVSGKKINSDKAYLYSAGFMFVIFLLSPLREELYSWYATWFIAFTCFLHKNKFIQNLVLVFSFGLMLRYIPYMATGDYFGPTPLIKIILSAFPPAAYLIYSGFKKQIKVNI